MATEMNFKFLSLISTKLKQIKAGSLPQRYYIWIAFCYIKVHKIHRRPRKFEKNLPFFCRYLFYVFKTD